MVTLKGQKLVENTKIQIRHFEQFTYCIGDQNRDQDRNDVGNLTSHLKDNHTDGNSMSNSTGKRGCAYCSISSSHNMVSKRVVFIRKATGKPNIHAFANYSSEGCANFESWNEYTCGDW